LSDTYNLPKATVTKAHRDFRRGERIRVGPVEIVNRLREIDRALNGDSNDDEHDALYTIREWLSGVLEDPERRF
jgi:hypothetical protein